MNPHYPDVSRRAGHRCEYCRAPEAVFNFPFEVEHVLPVSRGGGDAPANLALACRACNARKAAAVSGWDEVGAADAPLYHPREQRWAEHFAFDPDSGRVSGTTATGRATVDRLRMNDPVQLTARLVWADLGLYP